MTSSVLYSAGAKLTVDASHKFWLTGGELTTASRIQLAGPTKKTSLYDIAKDAWTESIDLPIAIAQAGESAHPDWCHVWIGFISYTRLRRFVAPLRDGMLGALAHFLLGRVSLYGQAFS